MKQILISFIYIVSSILLFTLILTLFNYFDIINNTSMFKIIITILSVLIGSIYLGMHTKNGGLTKGLELGILIVIFIIIYSILFSKLEFKNIIYYFILLITSSLGSVIGINIKKSN